MNTKNTYRAMAILIFLSIPLHVMGFGLPSYPEIKIDLSMFNCDLAEGWAQLTAPSTEATEDDHAKFSVKCGKSNFSLDIHKNVFAPGGMLDQVDDEINIPQVPAVYSMFKTTESGGMGMSEPNGVLNSLVVQRLANDGDNMFLKMTWTGISMGEYQTLTLDANLFDKTNIAPPPGPGPDAVPAADPAAEQPSGSGVTAPVAVSPDSPGLTAQATAQEKGCALGGMNEATAPRLVISTAGFLGIAIAAEFAWRLGGRRKRVNGE